MGTLYYDELFTQQGVVFRFQARLPTAGMGLESGLESESGSLNVNKPSACTHLEILFGFE